MRTDLTIKTKRLILRPFERADLDQHRVDVGKRQGRQGKQEFGHLVAFGRFETRRTLAERSSEVKATARRLAIAHVTT